MTGEPNLVKIELSETDCELFRRFREHQDTFQVLVSNKVFEVAGGNVTIHFDKDKKVSLIDFHTYIRL